MTKINKIITAAIAALALTTASLAIPGQAFAGGHGGMAVTEATGLAMVILAMVFLGIITASPFLRLQQLLEMEPLRPGQCLRPLLLIRDEEKKLVRAEKLGRVSQFHDDDHDRPPGAAASSMAGLSLDACSASATSLKRICPGFAFDVHRTEPAEKAGFRARQLDV